MIMFFLILDNFFYLFVFGTYHVSFSPGSITVELMDEVLMVALVTPVIHRIPNITITLHFFF